MYLHEHKHWTDFSWDTNRILPLLDLARFKQGHLFGRMAAMGPVLQQEAELVSLTEEIVTSSAIEGEHLNRNDVRSSVASKLGISSMSDNANAGVRSPSPAVAGAVNLIVDATQNYRDELTAERLFSWHMSLFPGGFSGLHPITTGSYRSSGMQVVSGGIGHEKVHFEAPPATVVPNEMNRFLAWCNEDYEPAGDYRQLIKAGIAHLWFITIHPFDDGNGRIARALTELFLARFDRTAQRYYSMSSYLLSHRKDYYQALETAQKSDTDITKWLEWFLNAYIISLDESEQTLERVLLTNSLLRTLAQVGSNKRQKDMVLRLVNGFEGVLTAKKWAKICKTSPDTALRDINDLIVKGILQKEPAGGRSASYTLAQIPKEHQ